MAQLVDFTILTDKPRDWHIYFLRELLGHVNEERPTERRYQKWIRERKIFERRFLGFCERLVGIVRAPEKPPELAEIGRELLGAIEKGKKKAEADAEALRKAAAKGPGRDAPKPRTPARAPLPEDELDEEKAFAEKPVEPAAADDPFVKALLERSCELNGYLTKFVFRELGDDFLAVNELFRRVGTSAYVGRKPSLPQFDTWVKWLEWMGGLQKVGFRHKATPAGKEQGKFLKDVPDAELTAPSREDELPVEPVAAPAVAEAGVPLVANAPTGRRTLEADEDGAPEEEGLDLPPAPTVPEVTPWAPPVEPFWANRPHDDQAAPRGPLPDPVIPAKAAPDLGAVLRGLTDEARSIGESVAAVPAAPAPPAASLSASGSFLAPVYDAERVEPTRRARLSRSAGHVLAWWREAGRPGERLTAREAALDLAIYRGAGRGLVVFKLLALASFLEATLEGGVAFFRELDGRGALASLFLEDATLDRVLEPLGLLDPARALAPVAERLVHLLRFRRALRRDGLLARLDAATDARDLARALRREVTGDSLSTGVVFVVREMARAGHWRAAGVDALACVPWRPVRETAHRLGLLDAAGSATFEDVLAASEALSRFFREAEEAEVPLLAFGASHAVPTLLEKEPDLP
jgi:hypothetical protein